MPNKNTPTLTSTRIFVFSVDDLAFFEFRARRIFGARLIPREVIGPGDRCLLLHRGLGVIVGEWVALSGWEKVTSVGLFGDLACQVRVRLDCPMDQWIGERKFFCAVDGTFWTEQPSLLPDKLAIEYYEVSKKYEYTITHLPPDIHNGELRVFVRRQLLAIDWFQFEHLCARLTSLRGWNVTRLGGSNINDHGIDFLAESEGKLVLVGQCKHLQEPVDEPFVSSFYGNGLSARFRANHTYLFSLWGGTAPARAFAKENRIRLIDLNMLIELIMESGMQNFPELRDPNQKRCPVCRAPMVYRETAKPFWGCEQYSPVGGCTGKIVDFAYSKDGRHRLGR